MILSTFPLIFNLILLIFPFILQNNPSIIDVAELKIRGNFKHSAINLLWLDDNLAKIKLYK